MIKNTGIHEGGKLGPRGAREDGRASFVSVQGFKNQVPIVVTDKRGPKRQGVKFDFGFNNWELTGDQVSAVWLY